MNSKALYFSAALMAACCEATSLKSMIMDLEDFDMEESVSLATSVPVIVAPVPTIVKATEPATAVSTVVAPTADVVAPKAVAATTAVIPAAKTEAPKVVAPVNVAAPKVAPAP